VHNTPIPPTKFVGNVKCATCVDKELTHGFQFEGSNAVFCDECANYIKEVRHGRRHAEYQAHHEERECLDCKIHFTCYASENQRRCRSCIKARKEQREFVELFDLFAPTAVNAEL